ncbi:MAG: hypothetical protein K2G84_00905, partial [Muribaculaceae bacterium]|nr:hypothetical protein [Muribaculaceae bacterium]
MSWIVSKKRDLAWLLVATCAISGAKAADSDAATPGGFAMTGRAEGIFAAGSGDFAPYYIASNNHGILTQSNDALLRLSLDKQPDTKKRFSYGFGIDFLTGYTSSTDYLRFSP